MMDRPDLQIDGFDAAERPFHHGEGFVAAHRRRVVEGFRRQAGAHDIDPVTGCLGGDLGGLAGEAEVGIGDVEIEVLGHFIPVDHRTDRQRDLGGATQRIALAGDGGLDAGEIALGGGQQVFALAGALGGKIRVAADHQTLIGKLGCGDAGDVALVEQRELQRAALQQPLDRRRAQRGDPIEAG